jgi:MFS family permease
VSEARIIGRQDSIQNTFELRSIHTAGIFMEKKLQNNIYKYAVLLIINKRLFVAILGAYYLTIPDVTPQIIGLILLAGNFSNFILEIPSGYLSDKIGHKKALIVAEINMVLSTTFFLLANNILFLVLGSVFMSASWAFKSGTGSAFMHETLQGLKRENEYVSIMGKISSVGFAVPAFLAALIPFFVSVSYKIPFLIVLILDFIGLLITISLVTPPVPPRPIEEVGITNLKQVLKEGYKLNYFSLALFSGIIFGTMMAIGGFRAPYQLFLGIPVIWFGIFFGLGRGIAALMLAFSGYIKKFINMLDFYKSQVVIFTFLILVLGVTTSPTIVVIVFIILNALYWGIGKIDEGYQLSVIKSSKFKATLLSVHSQISQIVGAIFGFSLGLMIEHISYRAGFLYIGILFFCVVFPIYLYIARKYKRGLYLNT